MSGTPKRPLDDGSHCSSVKYPHEEVGSSYSRLPTGPSVQFSSSCEIGLDGRLSKIQRTESRDIDKRSPLQSAYRVASVSSDSPFDSYQNVSEGKMDGRDFKGGIDQRIENRDSRTDMRDMHGDSKRDIVVKGDPRFENKGEGKEVKSDKEILSDAKNEMKAERESVTATGSSSVITWKDSKELHRVKKHSESQGAPVDPWPLVRPGSRVLSDCRKDTSVVDGRDVAEVNEAVGENKVDSKFDDRLKEKDRKKKDIKLREWGDSNKERSERRSALHVVSMGIDGKESTKDENEVDKWDLEKKDWEKLKEKDRDQIKKETLGTGDREALGCEKGLEDTMANSPEVETSFMDQRKQKDADPKLVEKEPREMKRERENNLDGDKLERRARLLDKDMDDAFVDGEGTTEIEKDSCSLGSQQRKRTCVSRGSSHFANHDSRSKSRLHDNEGTQGKSEFSSVVYKVGECMQDLIKLWKEYESSRSEKNADSTGDSPTLEIRIPAEHVTATNRKVRGGQLWGTDIYTDDSDLVAVLMHTGYCRPTAVPPPAAIQELRASVRVMPPQDSYTSMLRNNVRSRAWGAGIGCSYRVERCVIVKKGGGTIELEPCLTHTSAVEPTLAPVAVERTMTTRAAASNALRQQRFVREVTIQYNLCNEPWIKYGISVIADKGLKKPLFTSARLKKGEVLYLETHACRYELCFAGEKMVKASPSTQVQEEAEKLPNHHPHTSNGDKNDSDVLVDCFRWSRCKKALPQKVMRSIGIPLPSEYVEILEDGLDWEDVQWSQTGVWIAGKEYVLARAHFLSPN